MQSEVLPYAPDAWGDEKSPQIGYELLFIKYFYQPVRLRSKEEIVVGLKKLESETDDMLAEILGGR